MTDHRPPPLALRQSHGESQVTWSGPAAAALQNNPAITSVAGYFISICSYHLVIALWRTKEAECAAVGNVGRRPTFSIDRLLEFSSALHLRKVRWASPPRAPPDPLSAGLTVSERLVHTKHERKQTHENNNEYYLLGARAVRVRLLRGFAASASDLSRRLLNEQQHRSG